MSVTAVDAQNTFTTTIMSKTAQLVATEVSEITREQSLALTRNLVRTSIASIAFVRGLLPDDDFKTINLSGLTVRQIVPNSPDAKLLIQWIEDGIFSALAKNYLDEGTLKSEIIAIVAVEIIFFSSSFLPRSDSRHL